MQGLAVDVAEAVDASHDTIERLGGLVVGRGAGEDEAEWPRH
jgi:hypothetical protein